ncbi:hypothetical protein [Tahibacter amnicola]|uniref:Uncharacterized protein n=1 Tax=Tahibacter amnicola TaxID=2976241 RepID=A0ABY6BCH7_9GAMM|nr:hypothetical protein [Tahibacter amnicola]UXI67746.1 hypothetical protein N4264_23930 [Tahibacter amnicola]
MISRILSSALTLAMMAIGTAQAGNVDYRVWYFDDDGFHQEGDISYGPGPALVRPSWACGRRVGSPDYYRWVDGYGNTMSSANLSQDVHVWLPGKGCPYNALTIKYRDGSQTFAHQPGASYMEISTSSGGGWIDAQGKIPACNCLPNFPIKVSANWKLVPSISSSLKADLADPRRQTRVLAALRDLQYRMDELGTSLGERIAQRRRSPLGDREQSVQSVENAATDALALAAREASLCTDAAGSRQYTLAYAACGRAEAAVAVADRLAEEVQSVIAPQPGE